MSQSFFEQDPQFIPRTTRGSQFSSTTLKGSDLGTQAADQAEAALKAAKPVIVDQSFSWTGSGTNTGTVTVSNAAARPIDLRDIFSPDQAQVVADAIRDASYAHDRLSALESHVNHDSNSCRIPVSECLDEIYRRLGEVEKQVGVATEASIREICMDLLKRVYELEGRSATVSFTTTKFVEILNRLDKLESQMLFRVGLLEKSVGRLAGKHDDFVTGVAARFDSDEASNITMFNGIWERLGALENPVVPKKKSPKRKKK